MAGGGEIRAPLVWPALKANENGPGSQTQTQTLYTMCAQLRLVEKEKSNHVIMRRMECALKNEETKTKGRLKQKLSEISRSSLVK